MDHIDGDDVTTDNSVLFVGNRAVLVIVAYSAKIIVIVVARKINTVAIESKQRQSHARQCPSAKFFNQTWHAFISKARSVIVVTFRKSNATTIPLIYVIQTRRKYALYKTVLYNIILFATNREVSLR